MFSLTVMASSNDIFMADIVREGSTLVRSYATEHSEGNHGSAFVIMVCAPGDQVWARAKTDGNLSRVYYTSQFSGYLLHRL